MQPLKQSTAFTVIVGPILDSTGAEYTSAVIGDLSISKNGTEAAMASAATLTHVSNGHYTLVGTTGNTDTLGRLDIRCNKSTYQMPPMHFEVMAANAFDTLVTNGTLASTTSGRTIVVDAAGLADANAVKLGPSGSGTAQTAKDVGAINVTNLNTLSGHDPGATLGTGTSTLTQTQVSGGAYALNSSSFGFNAALDFTSTQKTSLNAATPQDSSGVTTLLGRVTAAVALASTFTGITSLAQWLGLLAGKQVGDSTARTEIRATGAGSGAFDETTDSQEALRDRGDAAWVTATSVAVSDKTGFSLTTAYDFAKGTVAMTESYAADGAAPTPAQALMLIQQALTEFTYVGADWTVNKLDGSTKAAGMTLDDATNPTSSTRSS